MFFLEVNGLCQTSLMTRKRCLEAAERGHQQQPTARVRLMKLDRKTNKDVFVADLY